jgi:hypothetical protein
MEKSVEWLAGETEVLGENQRLTAELRHGLIFIYLYFMYIYAYVFMYKLCLRYISVT